MVLFLDMSSLLSKAGYQKHTMGGDEQRSRHVYKGPGSLAAESKCLVPKFKTQTLVLRGLVREKE